MADDWNSVTVIGQRRNNASTRSVSANEAAKAKRSGASVDTEKRALGGKNASSISGPDFQRLSKVDRDNEVAPPPTIDRSIGQIISQTRQKKDPKMSQKDLANKINEAQTVVQSYENGTAVPSPQVLKKMERALGVRLMGKDIGEPLSSGPKGKTAKASTK